MDPTLAGQIVSHYKMLECIGAGGMGTVYRGLDTRLDRVVAIKILPKESMSDPERRRRFVLEAKTASSLNHPNIVTIYDIGVEDDLSFIVMEYVPGHTLAELIGTTGLPLPQVVKYAAQIADALGAAHAAGIVHRDLKPRNVLVTGKGLVKVLDFGLAKLADTPKVDQRTVTLDIGLTMEGTIIGTVCYMSPEQAEGRKVDSRSDVFAFGSVLYEMVTGRQAFNGQSTIATLSAILTGNPPPLGIGGALARRLEEIVRRCLEKDPDRRFQSMDEVRLILEELHGEFSTRSTGLSRYRATVRWNRRAPLWIALLSALLLFAAATWTLRSLPRQRTTVDMPPLTKLTSDHGLTAFPALSRDGKLLAYASDRSEGGNLDIWVQQIGASDPLRLTSDAADEYEPSFSPDGTQIAFRSDRGGGGIWVIPALGGGEARLIAAQGRRPQFSPDGARILYWVGGDFGKIYVVDASGGATMALRPEFFNARYPVWSPDGKHVLFHGARDRDAPMDHSAIFGEGTDWWITSADNSGPAISTGSLKVFRDAGIGTAAPGTRAYAPSAWLPGNHIIFSARLRDSVNVWQASLSPGTFKLSGQPVRLTLGTAEMQPSISVTGSPLRLVFASLVSNVDVWSVRADTDHIKLNGEAERLTKGESPEILVTASEDGRRIVFLSARTGNQDVWLKDLASGKETNLTRSPINETNPDLLRDGSRVAYVTPNADGNPAVYLAEIGADGLPGPVRKLCDNCGGALSFSRDRSRMLFGRYPPAKTRILDVETGRSTDILLHPNHNLWQSGFDPGNQWISFNVTPSPVRSHLYVARIPSGPDLPPAPVPVDQWVPLTAGDVWDDKPRWSPNGGTLYFISTRDGSRCVWSLRVHPATRKPLAPPAPFYHVHSPRLSMSNVELGPMGFSVARGRLLFNMGELTGNIWTQELPLSSWSPAR